MKSYVFKSRGDLSRWCEWMVGLEGIYPITIQVFKGENKHRSMSQNDLSHAWYREIAHQLGDQTPEDVKRECKLRFGVPILRAESEYFRKMYDKFIKNHQPPYQYWEKLEAMDLLPVTSLMTVGQMAEYMDAVYHEYSQRGVQLTESET